MHFNLRFQTTCNIAKVLSLRPSLQVVELPLSLSLGFDGVVGVVDSAVDELSVSDHCRTFRAKGYTYPLRPAITFAGSLCCSSGILSS